MVIAISIKLLSLTVAHVSPLFYQDPLMSVRLFEDHVYPGNNHY
jgi:hypothetical protein